MKTPPISITSARTQEAVITAVKRNPMMGHADATAYKLNTLCQFPLETLERQAEKISQDKQSGYLSDLINTAIRLVKEKTAAAKK